MLPHIRAIWKGTWNRATVSIWELGKSHTNAISVRSHSWTNLNLQITSSSIVESSHTNVLKCDKSFSRAGCLRKHMFTHSGERPHKCLLCNKSFALSERLKAHLKIHKKKQQSEQFSSVFKKIKFWKTLVFLPTFVKRLNQKNSNIFTSLRASWQTDGFADVTLVWEDGHQVEEFK